MGEEGKVVFEGWANCYNEEGGVVDFSLFGYDSYDQAYRQVELRKLKERVSALSPTPIRVRVEVLS